MADADHPRQDPRVRLSGAREEFLSSLPGRLDGLREGLSSLRQEPDAPGRREGVVRRFHAMAAAARVLGFASVAEALASCERVLVRAEPAILPDDFHDVERILGTIPLLIGLTDAPLSPSALPEPSEDSTAAEAPSSRPSGATPLALLVLGDATLADAVRASAEAIDVEHAATADEASRFAETHGPDVVVVDAAAAGAAEFVEGAAPDTPIVVVTTVDRSDASARWIARGAAVVIGKPASPEAIRRAARDARGKRRSLKTTHEPLGEIAISELAERLAAEMRRGLLDATAVHERRVDLGQGAEVLGAVWGAIARVREIVTLRSAGAVRFQPTGPAGAAPFGAWSPADPGGGQRSRRGGRAGRDIAGIPLQGRKIVVADDDPAVAWFVSGLLAAVGVDVIEAHDGMQAEKLVFERWPDAVVSDVVMPGKDGFSLCARIKRDVAVRDVPVMLLSWKEDLLLRLRELGADADAYLRKEAPASLFVERLREVLRPRARVEGRLDAGGEVRGRLDGLTPRLVLDLVCRRKLDACVSFSDAAYLYEVEVRDGVPRSATRTASDGSFARGAHVLPGLLGVGVGRFGVRPDGSPCREQLQGTLEELLAEPIAKARAAQLALEPGQLAQIERVELDLTSISSYLPALPPAAASLVQGLAEGRPPRELMWSAGGFVERLLDDLARRGAVRGVWGRDGEDRLGAAAAELVPAAEPEPAPPPAFTFQLSPAPPPAAALPPIVIDSFSAEPPPAHAQTESEVSDAQSQAASEALERAIAALDVATAPAAADPAPAPPQAVNSEPSGEPAPQHDSAVVRLVDSGWDDAPPPSLSEPQAAAEREPPRAAEPEPVAVAESVPAPPAEPEPPPAAEPAPPPAAESEPAASAAPAPPAEPFASPLPPESPPSPASEPAMPTSARRLQAPKELTPDALDLGTAVLAAVAAEAPRPRVPSQSDRKRPRPLPRQEPRAEPQSPALRPVIADSEIALAKTIKIEPPEVTPAKLGAAPEPAPAEEPSLEGAVEAAPREPASARELPQVSVAEERKPGRSSGPEIELGATLEAADEDLLGANDSSPAIAPVTAPVGIDRTDPAEPRVAADLAPQEEERVSAEEPPPPRGRIAQRVWGAARVTVITAAAAAFSYGVVRFAVAPRIAGETTPPAAATAAEPQAPVAPVRAKTAAPAAPRVEELEIPSDIPVGPDKGLLEIEVGERHALYVDGVFVGRGPVRRVPLEPGKHEIEVRASSGEPAKHEVSVRPGRRTRWEMPAPPK